MLTKNFTILFLSVVLLCSCSRGNSTTPTKTDTNIDYTLSTPAFISDGMVLQQRSHDPIWGWASPGQEITVKGSWHGSEMIKTKTNSDGKWMVKVNTPEAGGPYKLIIKGKQKIIIHNVMIGEVWLCSGQSNMAMPVKGFRHAPILRSKQVINNAHYPDIRLFTVKRHRSAKPLTNVQGAWASAMPKTVAKFSATAYFFGRYLYKKLKVPIGLINSSWGGTVAEAWTNESALRLLGYFDKKLNEVDRMGRLHISPKNKNTPTVLYNGMIAPLIPFQIRGVIWYQGEANVGRAKQYSRLFPRLIKGWRKQWNEGKFPFYFVQIAPFPYGKRGRGNGTAGAVLRNAQSKALALPNTGMVVTMDIGDTTIIHPPNKEAVGRRLSLWALSHLYEKNNLVYSGPLYENVRFHDGKAILSFSHVDGGLVAKGGELNGFEIAGEDGKFVPAHAAIKGEHVIVYSDKVNHPKVVRYGWNDTAQPYLFNKAGLPASTFSTVRSAGKTKKGGRSNYVNPRNESGT